MYIEKVRTPYAQNAAQGSRPQLPADWKHNLALAITDVQIEAQLAAAQSSSAELQNAWRAFLAGTGNASDLLADGTLLRDTAEQAQALHANRRWSVPIIRPRRATWETKKRAAAPPNVVTSGPADSNDLLDDLREIYKNHDAIDTRGLSPDKRQAWFDGYTKTMQAIIVLETNTLPAINQKLGGLADNITQAIDACEKALHGVQDAAIVIQTVAVALGAIAQIALLLA